MTSVIDKLINHIDQSQYDDLPQSAIDAAITFIFDSIGVGLSGSRVENLQKIKQGIKHWGEGKQAQVWVTGEWLPAHAAAAINGYQIHNQEWDCVHEKAVVHPMAVILSSLMAVAQRENVSGKQLILGVVIAVDVATLIGGSVTSGLKFFRPSMCGALGATAGMAAVLQLDKQTTINAMGISYSQLSGTMQSHVEGSPMLAWQIGVNAHNAVNAIDMALAGFEGPKDILEGQFGYFNLMEDEFDTRYLNDNIGINYQIEQISHKPFPTGRASHGTVDGLLTLQQQHGFTWQDIEHIHVAATPLINRLVGRAVKDNMPLSYAKLCNGFIAARALLTGQVTVNDFDDEILTCPTTLTLAKKLTTELNDVADPNALAPVTVTVTLNNGEVLTQHLPAILGHPDRPFKREAQVTKFRAACASAITPFNDSDIDKLINVIDDLPQIQNINSLVSMLCCNDK